MMPGMQPLPARGLCPMLPGAHSLPARGLCPMLSGASPLPVRGLCPVLPSPGTLRGTLRRLLRRPGVAPLWRSLETMYCTAFDA